MSTSGPNGANLVVSVRFALFPGLWKHFGRELENSVFAAPEGLGSAWEAVGRVFGKCDLKTFGWTSGPHGAGVAVSGRFAVFPDRGKHFGRELENSIFE